jgi:glycosyltransferase involved in cell wall biosynthesis
VKILVLTPFPAVPGASGGGVAAFNLIRNLALRHEVVCLTYARAEERASLAVLAPYCTEVIAVPFPGDPDGSALGRALYLCRRVVNNCLSFLTLTPALTWKYRSSAMGRALKDAIARYRPDAVHICFAAMAHWVDACGTIPAVMDTQDVATVSGFRRAAHARTALGRAYHFVQWLFWLRYEMRYYPRYGKVLTVTRQDAAALKLFRPELDIYPDAIGIDVVAGQPASAPTARIGFLGSFAHQPNVDAVTWFVKSIFPDVRARCSTAEFMIAGKQPPECVLAMDGVIAVGFVDDVAGFYGSVDVVVAPLRHGGGIKIKVLEAMAHAKAVVTTSIGAEGIAEAGEGVFLVADAPAAFSDAVVALLSDAERRAELGERAWRLIEERFSRQRLCDDLDAIYRAMALHRQGEER